MTKELINQYQTNFFDISLAKDNFKIPKDNSKTPYPQSYPHETGNQ